MSLSGTRLHGQAVKTQPSHGCNRGSNPLGVTIQSISGTFRCPISFRDLTPVLRLVSRPATGCTLARRALAVKRIPLESPKKHGRFYVRVFRCSDPCFASRFTTRNRLHARAPCARCKANPLGVTNNYLRTFLRSYFFYTPVLRFASRPATGCTLTRFGARSFLFFPRKLSLPQPANCEL